MCEKAFDRDWHLVNRHAVVLGIVVGPFVGDSCRHHCRRLSLLAPQLFLNARGVDCCLPEARNELNACEDFTLGNKRDDALEEFW